MERRYLEQATQAERLARCITDNITIERLLAFAAECRAKSLNERKSEAS
jgi:hypothetical protein